VSSGGPDLFVICKNCGSEVSPYITECPYCGNRLRKRAPKIDRHGRVAEKEKKGPSPRLTRLRSGEIPGIRGETHPYATIILVAGGLLGCLLWRTGLVSLSNVGVITGVGLNNHWWRIFTSSFTYSNTGYAFVALAVIGLYGTLMEHRHGPIAVIVIYLLGAVGGLAVAAVALQSSHDLHIYLGANGAALALLVAWAIPDIRARLSHTDYDGDLLGTAVLAGVVALIPLAAIEASWISAGVGVLVGLVAGSILARVNPR